MKKTREQKIEDLYAFAKRVRENGALVTIETEHGDEVYDTRKGPDGQLIWTKLKDAKADDAA